MPDDRDRQRAAQCDTLDDIMREGFAIEIRCRCGRTRIIEAKPYYTLCLAKRISRHLINAGRFLRCTACGKKWPSLVATPEAPTGPPIGPTDERSYKRLLRELR